LNDVSQILTRSSRDMGLLWAYAKKNLMDIFCRLSTMQECYNVQESGTPIWGEGEVVEGVTGTFVPWNFHSLEHSLPNAKSKTWSFHSPCFKCVFLSKVTRIASSMLNRVYRSTSLLPSHQSHDTVRAGIEAVVTRNQRTPTRGVVDNCPPCS